MFENVFVKEWMSEKVVSASPSMRISEAHQVMKDAHIRRLPVVNEQGVLVGIVTIGDVREASPSDATTLSIWELNYLWAQLTVERIMTRKVLTVTPETPILTAAEMMLENKISGLPVVDDKGRVVGMLTESDVFRMLIRSEVNS